MTEAKRRMGTVSKSATFLATESVNSAPFKTGETKVQVFGKEKRKIFANTKDPVRCKFLARKSAKLNANFSATKVTSLPSLSLSVSLSLSHRAHLTHNVGSASARPIILPHTNHAAKKVSNLAKLFISSWRGPDRSDNTFTAQCVQFQRYRRLDKCGAVLPSIDDLPACFCIWRYLCLGPTLLVASSVAL